tara:strand:- start:5095 stop:5787 length:693 start_codon:yes stop_codon:yes gene_type:complete
MPKNKSLIIFSFLFLFSCTNIGKVSLTEKIGFSGNLGSLSSYKKNTQAVVAQDFKGNSLKITNLANQKSINLQYIEKKLIPESRIIYISDAVASSLGIEKNLPYVKIESIKKNPTFVANKAKIFKEERKIKKANKVNDVKIISLSGGKNIKKDKYKNLIYLEFGSFYYLKYAKDLKNSLKEFLSNQNIAIKGSPGNYLLIIGPISNMNKYDLIYSKLKTNNFEGYQIKVK